MLADIEKQEHCDTKLESDVCNQPGLQSGQPQRGIRQKPVTTFFFETLDG
jgi:hypothetical protein